MCSFDEARIEVPSTKEGLGPREIAISVIASKLGVRPEAVNDETPLGGQAEQICMIVAIKTGKQMIGNRGMKAKDVFRQLT